MDLHENKQTNTVTATFELPGLKKEDVSIEAHDDRLTISAQSSSSTDSGEAGSGYAVRERRFGKIVRTLQLPLGVKVRFMLARSHSIDDTDVTCRRRISKRRWKMEF
jgi:HSP20 family protein